MIKRHRFKKHRILGKIFIKNRKSEEFTVIDSSIYCINRCRNDNRLFNFGWAIQAENLKNKSSDNYGHDFEFFDVIPDDAIVVDKYGN